MRAGRTLFPLENFPKYFPPGCRNMRVSCRKRQKALRPDGFISVGAVGQRLLNDSSFPHGSGIVVSPWGDGGCPELSLAESVRPSCVAGAQRRGGGIHLYAVTGRGGLSADACSPG